MEMGGNSSNLIYYDRIYNKDIYVVLDILEELRKSPFGDLYELKNLNEVNILFMIFSI